MALHEWLSGRRQVLRTRKILHQEYVVAIALCNSLDLSLNFFVILGIYVNLAMETKQYVDVKDAEDNREEPIARKSLLAFYNFLPLLSNFAAVTRGEFHEIMERGRNEKKKRKVPDASGLKRIVSLGVPPPPKCTAGSAASGAIAGAAERVGSEATITGN